MILAWCFNNKEFSTKHAFWGLLKFIPFWGHNCTCCFCLYFNAQYTLDTCTHRVSMFLVTIWVRLYKSIKLVTII